MAGIRNILFIMCDQLRADYLSCMGHASLETPAIDALAEDGVAFSKAYVQAPVCGPSRMSFYTGRYMISHGSTYNNVPLSVGEWTLGDYMRPLGLRTVLVGKTHMAADADGFRRLGIDAGSPKGVLASQCGFEPYWRDDGLHPQGNPDLAYNRYLNAEGYGGDNPWHDFANSVEGPKGEVLSGWHMQNAHLPARVAEQHSETAYTTGRAMDFIGEAGDDPWCLHLSYIKPHWPYIAPAPYHAFYKNTDVQAAIRDPGERQNPHPVVAAFMDHVESQAFAREQVRARVIPAYMGLIRQIDDHIGRLMAFLKDQGRYDDTLIVFTSDHGDYLGDHWLGEKDLFHEPSVRVPLIIRDPGADATRATQDGRLVESIDLIPTFIEALGGAPMGHRLEGRSLLGAVRGSEAASWRQTVFSECDYAFRGARATLGVGPAAARAMMARSDRWKYIWYQGFRPQLFDLQNDPDEFTDRAGDPAMAGVLADMHERLFQWLATRRNRRTISDEAVAQRTDTAQDRGFLFGVW